LALIFENDLEVENEIKLLSLKVCSETGEIPNATVTLFIEGQEKTGNADGGGVVDASLKAIESLTQTGATLTLYSVNNITTGTDAQGEVTVRLEKSGRVVHGSGADTDIVIASAKAYLNAVNKLNSAEQRCHPQKAEV
jgi:2-isopropylmalate synthase